MESTVTKLIDAGILQDSEAKSFCLGKIIMITDEGRALVDYPDNQMGPLAARSVIDVPARYYRLGTVNIPVLMVFEDGDLNLPIIVGIIQDTVFPVEPSEEIILKPVKQQRDVVVDGKKMVFDAKEEIVLRCGKSSVTLKKDGKIVVKGTRITNRASATNKIKGASVLVN
jgi:hypothetical protein